MNKKTAIKYLISKININSKQGIRLYNYVLDNIEPFETPCKALKRILNPFTAKDFEEQKEGGKSHILKILNIK